MNSKKRIAATVYSLGTLFLSGIYVQIPCIKVIMTIIIVVLRTTSIPLKFITLSLVSKNNSTTDIVKYKTKEGKIYF
jgi:hypothetical protein